MSLLFNFDNKMFTHIKIFILDLISLNIVAYLASHTPVVTKGELSIN